MFKKFKDLLSRHKILAVICLLALIIIIILFYMFCSIFVGGNDKYGSRLNGIEKVELSKSDLKDVADTIEKDESVDSVEVRLQGKIIYIDIVYKKDVSKDKAKEFATKTLDNFDDDAKEFYDFEYVLSQIAGDGEEDTGFKITGAKTPKTDSISFIKS